MLSTIMGMFGGQIIEKLFGTFGEIIARWQQKQITEIEAKQAMALALTAAFKEIEVAHEQALTAIYQSFMGAVVQSPIMQRTWAFITISQGLMLLWFQIGIPVVVLIVRQWNDKFNFPSSGNTADWAYALVGGCLGLGLAMKGTGVAGALKSLIGK